MSIVKILAIIVVTAVVTLLCIRSGQAMAKTAMPSPSPPPSPPAGTVYRPVTGNPEVHKPEIHRPEVSKPKAHIHPGNASNVNSTRLEPSMSTSATSVDSNSTTNATSVRSGSSSNVTSVRSGLAPNATSVRSGLAWNVPSVRSGSASNATSVNRTNPIVSTATGDQKENGSIVLEPATVNQTFTKPSGGGGGDMLATSRSLVHSTPSTTSRRRGLPILVRGKLIRHTPYPANHKTGSNVEEDRSDDEDDDHGGGGDDNNEANIVVDAGVYHVNDGPYLRQIDHNNQYTTLKDTDTSMAQEDGSTGYHNSYDVTYTVGAGHGANDGWNPTSRPNVHGGGGSTHPAGASGAVPANYPMGRPPYVPYPYPIGFIPTMPGYKQNPMPPPNYQPQQHYHQQQSYNNNGGGHQVEQYNVFSPLQQIQMITEKIDWQKIGILALFKVGLAKLKAFGFLKILFLLVFKLKMFLIAVFFKFLLIVKLMKFFKLLMIPLIFVTLLPIIASLFSAPMLVGGLLSVPSRILQYLTEPVYAPVPGAAVAATTKNSAASGGGSGGPLPTVTSAKSGDLNALVDRRRLETLELFDPAMSVFRKLLDSEKCVERIACRMAVVEKTGILPVWINWVLHQVSKFIPNEKLESYLNAYDDVNKEIYIQSDTPDNWATWCIERYGCNTTRSSTGAINVTETKQQ